MEPGDVTVAGFRWALVLMRDVVCAGAATLTPQFTFIHRVFFIVSIKLLWTVVEVMRIVKGFWMYFLYQVSVTSYTKIRLCFYFETPTILADSYIIPAIRPGSPHPSTNPIGSPNKLWHTSKPWPHSYWDPTKSPIHLQTNLSQARKVFKIALARSPDWSLQDTRPHP